MSSAVGTLPEVVAQAVATIALGLLAFSGIAKLADPDPTTGAMRAARLPAAGWISRGLGLIEAVVAVVAVVALGIGGVAVAAAALLYLSFSVFTFAAVRNRIPVQSCGCFGREDTPPSGVHVVFNALSTVALVFLAITTTPPVDWSMPVVETLLYLGFAVIGVAISLLLLTRLPRLRDLTRS